MTDPLYDPALGHNLVERSAVVRGAVVGLALIVPITIVGALLDRALDDFEDSVWRFGLLVLILAAYFVAGFVAGRLTLAPWTNGALAGLGAFVLWIPVRILIWVIRDENRGLVSGSEPVLRIGQIFGQLVLAAALGMLGGFIGARGRAASPPE